jgi:UDP-2,3-diacylglucosamine hydrolase
MIEKIAVIAGAGGMPKSLFLHLQQQQIPFFVIAYHGHTDQSLIQDMDHEWFAFGQVGKVFKALKDREIQSVVFAGGGLTPRPSLKNLSVDGMGLKLLRRIGLRWGGDNQALKVVSAFLEENGFRVCAPQDFIPPLLAKRGCLTHTQPQQETAPDLLLGKEMLAALSPLDFGQGIAIQNGLVLGVEAAEGTDACILRCGKLQRPTPEPPPVYIKRAKINQDERCDLPAIGLKTIESLKEAGFQGIAIQSEKTLILEASETLNLANQYGLFILSVE